MSGDQRLNYVTGQTIPQINGYKNKSPGNLISKMEEMKLEWK